MTQKLKKVSVYNYSYECLKLKSQNKTVALTFVRLAEATIFILWLLEYCLVDAFT